MKSVAVGVFTALPSSSVVFPGQLTLTCNTLSTSPGSWSDGDPDVWQSTSTSSPPNIDEFVL